LAVLEGLRTVKALSPSPVFGVAAARALFNGKLAAREDQPHAAAAQRVALESASSAMSGKAPSQAAEVEQASDLAKVASEIADAVDSRLHGRVQQLSVRVENGQFVLSGACSSYYVKQVAQHLAMHAMDARVLGRLVNEIEVRPPR
jgi:hypothetical protein